MSTKRTTSRGEALGHPERAAIAFIEDAYRAYGEMEDVERDSGRFAIQVAAAQERLINVTRMAAEQAIERTTLELRRALYDLIEQGLPGTAPDILVERYAVSLRQVADWLATSPKTLSRRAGLLRRTESDLALRYGRLFEQAKQAFGTEEAAREWLTSRQPALGGAVPVDLLRTELGARQVEQTLELIDYGDYI